MRYEISPLGREEQALLNEVISSQFGIYFPESKRQILESRLEPRLRELRLKRYLDYYLKLQYDLDSERETLVRLVTNNETYFFREEAQFESLFTAGVEPLLSTAPTPGRLRFLSAGCSSGEEPYTLNIFAKQNRFRLGGAEVCVDAFDIDRDRLQLAERGEYSQRSLRVASSERSQRFFRQQGENAYQLKEVFRQGVRFRWGNIVDPASYTPGYDVIFCRNVLIYFSEVALHRAIDNFAKALRPGGLLFLGHSESIIGLSKKLETVRLGSSIAYKRTPL